VSLVRHRSRRAGESLFGDEVSRRGRNLLMELQYGPGLAGACDKSRSGRGCLTRCGHRGTSLADLLSRHLFVPNSTSTAAVGSTAQEASVDRWLNELYSGLTLVVQRRPVSSRRAGDGEHAALPTISSTMPSLMVKMLEALDLAVSSGGRDTRLDLGPSRGLTSS
jgi:hypothetical protein